VLNKNVPFPFSGDDGRELENHVVVIRAVIFGQGRRQGEKGDTSCNGIRITCRFSPKKPAR